MLPTHRTIRRGGDEARVFGEGAAGVLRRRRGPGVAPSLQLVRGQGHLEAALWDVDGDGIAFLNKGDGAAIRGFWCDVAHGHAVGGPGKAAVGDEGDLLTEPPTEDGACDGP